MIRFIFSILVFISIFTLKGYANENIIYKYLDNNKYIVYSNSLNESKKDMSTKGFIARHLMRSNFNIANLSPKYYSVEKSENLIYFGFNLTQYIITPKDPNRFKYVLWLNERNLKDNFTPLVKVEAYDVYNKLMYSFLGFDFIEGNLFHDHGRGLHLNIKEDNKSKVNKIKPENCPNKKCVDNKCLDPKKGKGYYYHADNTIKGNKETKYLNKYKFRNSDEFYKGFRHFHTTVFKNEGVDLVFVDGVNRFSVFIKKSDKDFDSESRIIYGNNFYTRVVDGYEYILFGTVTYGFMEEVIDILRKDVKSVIKTVSEGNALVQE